jgi:hypothetical protein
VVSVAALRRWVDGSNADGTFLQRAVTLVVGFAVVGALIELNTIAFRTLFDTDYLRWYLANGTVIGITFGLITVAWGDLNKMTGLISAHPHDYVATCITLGVLPLLGSSALITTPDVLRRRKAREEAQLERYAKLGELADNQDQAISDDERQRLRSIGQQARDELAARAAPTEEPQGAGRPEHVPRGLGPLDIALGIVFTFGFQVAFLAWLLVIAPVQYVVNLAAGAAARRAVASPVRAWYSVTPRRINIGESEKTKSLPEDAMEAKFSANPVTVTSAVAAALLFVVSKLALG